MKKVVMIAVFVAVMAMSSLALAADAYVTKHGKKFHTATCQLIKNKETTKIDDADAAKQGYLPCSKCHKAEKQEKN